MKRFIVCIVKANFPILALQSRKCQNQNLFIQLGDSSHLCDLANLAACNMQTEQKSSTTLLLQVTATKAKRLR